MTTAVTGPTGTQVVPWEKRSPNEKRVSFEKTLVAMASKVRELIPSHLDYNKFKRAFIVNMTRNPKLLGCTQLSLLGSMVTCAQLGLMPDALNGEAWLLPFNNRKKVGDKWESVMECQLIVGYKGFRKLAMQTNTISNIYAVPVYEGDHFIEKLGLDRDIEHTKGDESARAYDDPAWVYANFKGVYAVVRFKDGTKDFISMTKSKIEGRRKLSPSQKNWDESLPKADRGKPFQTPVGVWLEHYEKMALKTGIRELCGTLTLSAELNQAVAIDETVEIRGENQRNAGELGGIDLADLDIPEEFAQYIDVTAEQDGEAAATDKQNERNEKKIAQGNNVLEGAIKESAGKKGGGRSSQNAGQAPPAFEVVKAHTMQFPDEMIDMNVGDVVEFSTTAGGYIFNHSVFPVSELQKGVQNGFYVIKS